MTEWMRERLFDSRAVRWVPGLWFLLRGFLRLVLGTEHASLTDGARRLRDIVEETNSPNSAYKGPSNRASLQSEYDFIRSRRCATGSLVGREAVA